MSPAFIAESRAHFSSQCAFGAEVGSSNTREIQKTDHPDGIIRFWSCWADSNCRMPAASQPASAAWIEMRLRRGGRQFEYGRDTKNGLSRWDNPFWSCWADSNCRMPAASQPASAAWIEMRLRRGGRQFEYGRDTKNGLSRWDNPFLELLGRFELPTSSLPMTRSTD